jgi:hypothetical protein
MEYDTHTKNEYNLIIINAVIIIMRKFITEQLKINQFYALIGGYFEFA